MIGPIANPADKTAGVSLDMFINKSKLTELKGRPAEAIDYILNSLVNYGLAREDVIPPEFDPKRNRFFMSELEVLPLAARMQLALERRKFIFENLTADQIKANPGSVLFLDGAATKDDLPILIEAFTGIKPDMSAVSSREYYSSQIPGIEIGIEPNFDDGVASVERPGYGYRPSGDECARKRYPATRKMFSLYTVAPDVTQRLVPSAK